MEWGWECGGVGVARNRAVLGLRTLEILARVRGVGVGVGVRGGGGKSKPRGMRAKLSKPLHGN